MPNSVKQHNLIERMLDTPEDWRRIATRYDRCTTSFFGVICIATTTIF